MNITTYESAYKALTALLLATEGLSTPFTLYDATQKEGGYIDILNTAVRPEGVVGFSNSDVVTGLGLFDIGYIHAWSTRDGFLYTIHVGSVRD